ncbi:ribosomal_L18e/L15P domain-containing protein, partial [Haematococcus lacustris]
MLAQQMVPAGTRCVRAVVPLQGRAVPAALETVDRSLAVGLASAQALRVARPPSTGGCLSSVALLAVMQKPAQPFVQHQSYERAVKQFLPTGMSAGLPDFVVVNLERLNSFSAGEEINLETLKEKGIVRASGRRASLPLKVLGTGKLNAGVKIAAAAFSKSAEEKIKAAGGEAVKLPGKVKWTKKAYKRQVAALKKAGKDYKTEMLKKKVARLVAKGRVNPKRLVAKTKTKPEAASGTGRKVKKTA